MFLRFISYIIKIIELNMKIKMILECPTIIFTCTGYNYMFNSLFDKHDYLEWFDYFKVAFSWTFPGFYCCGRVKYIKPAYWNFVRLLSFLKMLNWNVQLTHVTSYLKKLPKEENYFNRKSFMKQKTKCNVGKY